RGGAMRSQRGIVGVLTPFVLFWGGISGTIRADEASTARRFESAKQDEPSLIAFLKAMPKGGDLHLPVGPAAYAATALDNALKRKLFFNPATSLFEEKEAPGSVSPDKFLEDEAGPYLSQFLDNASMRGMRPGKSGHDHFFRTFDVVGSGMVGMNSDDAI